MLHYGERVNGALYNGARFNHFEAIQNAAHGEKLGGTMSDSTSITIHPQSSQAARPSGAPRPCRSTVPQITTDPRGSGACRRENVDALRGA